MALDWNWKYTIDIKVAENTKQKNYSISTLNSKENHLLQGSLFLVLSFFVATGALEHDREPFEGSHLKANVYIFVIIINLTW